MSSREFPGRTADADRPTKEKDWRSRALFERHAGPHASRRISDALKVGEVAAKPQVLRSVRVQGTQCQTALQPGLPDRYNQKQRLIHWRSGRCGARVLSVNPITVSAALNVRDPFGIVQIPLNGFANTCFKCFRR